MHALSVCQLLSSHSLLFFLVFKWGMFANDGKHFRIEIAKENLFKQSASMYNKMLCSKQLCLSKLPKYSETSLNITNRLASPE